MSRVKRGVAGHAKHKKVLQRAKGFYGRRKNTIRAAKAAVDHALVYSYRDRKNRKRTFRVVAGRPAQDLRSCRNPAPNQRQTTLRSSRSEA